ncbi:MAG: hypothetical protein AB8G14_04240 [Ilumatobacter sp.]
MKSTQPDVRSRPPEAVGELLVAGGDERLTLDSNGRNKYHLDPLTSRGLFHRGSCTCSPLTEEGQRTVDTVLVQLRNGTVTSADLAERQRDRLLELFVPDSLDGTGVIFAPSGSDLCYLPLMFSSLLYPGQRIVNVVATSEELGSGSLLAHDGRYYAVQSQLHDDLPIGERVSGDLDVECVLLPARDERGAIFDHVGVIERLIAQRRDGEVLIVNLVIGSKSGIENGVRIIERFDSEDIMWTVDLCQMRARPALFERLLELGCLLLCTGSKFYEAPPFCGAMLAPPVWIDQLAKASTDTASITAFDTLFSSMDFPQRLSQMGRAFSDFDNVGLRLRWEAALQEMEAFDAVAKPDTAEVIAQWSACVVERIGQSHILDLLRDDARTNDSIVSFKVRDGHGGHLDQAGLGELRRVLAVDGVPELAAFERALIGQPVAYPSGAFLRVALGSSDVRCSAASGFDPADDLALIDALERVAEELR